jgi:hypothetical protein
MTTDEQLELLREVVRVELQHMRRLVEQALTPAARPAPGDVLNLAAAADVLGIRPRTLRDGKAGTSSIPRYSDRPVQFLRASLDEFKRNRMERARRLTPARPPQRSHPA